MGMEEAGQPRAIPVLITPDRSFHRWSGGEGVRKVSSWKKKMG